MQHKVAVSHATSHATPQLPACHCHAYLLGEWKGKKHAMHGNSGRYWDRGWWGGVVGVGGWEGKRVGN